MEGNNSRLKDLVTAQENLDLKIEKLYERYRTQYSLHGKLNSSFRRNWEHVGKCIRTKRLKKTKLLVVFVVN